MNLGSMEEKYEAGDLTDIIRATIEPSPINTTYSCWRRGDDDDGDDLMMMNNNNNNNNNSNNNNNELCGLFGDPFFSDDPPLLLHHPSTFFSSTSLINNSSPPATSTGTDGSHLRMLQISSPTMKVKRSSAMDEDHSRNPMKRRKSSSELTKKIVCIPAVAPVSSSRPASGEIVPSDLWAWRKYGQKPIKGSPYPRGYYRCSSSKGCSARKQVERSRTDPNMLVITYTSDHNHPWPTHRNALAGSTRTPSKSMEAN